MNGNLYEALAKAQAEMPAVEPNATNPHFKSKFVTLDHLIAKTKPTLTKNGLTISQWPVTSDDGTPSLLTRLAHSSGEFVESTMPLLLGKNDMQGLGSALTYARRYAWAAVLGISEEADDDGNQASQGSRPSSSRGAASKGAETGGVESRGAASPQGGTPSDAGDSAAAPSPKLQQLLDLGKRWKELKPEWDENELQNWLTKKPRSQGELDAAIETYTHNIAEATSEFQIPTRGKKAAA